VGIAILAGASLSLAARLGLECSVSSLQSVQSTIWRDAGADAIGKQPSPSLPALFGVARHLLWHGLGDARLCAAASVGVGALSFVVLGLADGLLYDLRSRGALWRGRRSLPESAYCPSTPGGELVVPCRRPFWPLPALAVVAGVALALANAYGDIENDTRAGVRTVATVLGGSRTLW